MLFPRAAAASIARAGAMRILAAAILGIVLAIAFTWPVGPRLGSVGRFDTGDGHWSIWCVAWVAHALATDPGDLYDANIFYPHQDTLAYSENNIVAGVLGLPAMVLTGNPYATHNLAMLAGFALAFLCAWALARHLTGETGLAIAAGLAFAFCPFMFARTAHIQLMMFFGLPLTLLALHRAVASPTPLRGLGLGLALVVAALSCGYYGIFAALLAGFGLIFFAGSRGLWRRGAFWVCGAIAAVTSIAIVAPFFVPYVRVQAELGFARSVEEAAVYSADWQAWLASSAWAHRWIQPLLGHWNEVLFPGALTTIGGIAGAIVALRRSPPDAAAAGADAARLPGRQRDVAIFYVLVGLLAFWISFGPAAGLYRLLFATIPVFSFLRAPSRIGIVVVLALAMLAAIGGSRLLAGLTPSRRRLIGAGVAVAMAAELFTAPLQMREAPPVSHVYRYLATAQRGPVLELPFFYERIDFARHARYMSASGWHWQPLINGYSDHIPAEFRELAPRLHGFPSGESFLLLRERRARYVVIHRDLYGRRDLERLLERLTAYAPYLTLRVTDGAMDLYEITAWPQ
jgi:hypothetical protein